jgi:CDP-diacylglycerol--glycerol-3-phosphate 3-phosphatidyltransferase
MLTDRARQLTRGLVEPVARGLGRLGLTPNALTALGFVLHLGVAWLLAMGWLAAGAVGLALAAAFDGLDGTLARLTGRSSARGAFLDSTFDRMSEVAVFFGLLLFANRSGLAQEVWLVYVALAGSLLVSYTRARSEGIGCPTKAGVFGRLERMAVLVVGLFFGWLTVTLWVLVLGAWLTVALRIRDVWRRCAPAEESP